MVNGHPIATVGAGSVLGEMALLDLRPRSATLVALTDVELISYGSEQFRTILDEMPADARAALKERGRFRAENLEVGYDDDRPRPSGRCPFWPTSMTTRWHGCRPRDGLAVSRRS